MEDFNAIFATQTTASKLSNFKPVAMKNGLATLADVSQHTSDNGICVKLTFADNLDKEDAQRGHVEYLSTSWTGLNFQRSYRKLLYLMHHSNNAEGTNALNAIGTPYIPVEQDGKAISFVKAENESLKDKIDGYKASLGEDITVIEHPSIDNTFFVVRFQEKSVLIPKLVNAFKLFVDTEYYLKVKLNDRGFQQLDRIEESKL